MNRVDRPRITAGALLLALSLPGLAQAQLPPPPPAAAPPPPAAASSPLQGVNTDIETDGETKIPPAEGETKAADDAAKSSDAKPDDKQPQDKDTKPGEAKSTTPGAMSEEEVKALEAKQAERLEQLKTHSAFNGSTGLMRTHFAGSGPVGSFRFGVLGSTSSTKSFLCPQCDTADGGDGSRADSVSRVSATIQLGATLYDFLEAYGSIISTATSNSLGDPQLLQVLGDSVWGLKAFMPREPDQVFTAGGAVELGLLNGTGSVGFDQPSFAFRGLTSLDLTTYSKAEDRIPLRLNFNLSYVFDNSGSLVKDVEFTRHRRITRIERFGLNINRVDRLTPAIGIEGAFEVVRPYVEWSIDIPNNRQNYLCSEPDVHAGDTCLSTSPTFASVPARLTIGARANAFLDGLSFHAALDLATGGNKPPFWEEVQPELPWNLYFGINYAADTQPRIERVLVEAPPAEQPKPVAPPARYALAGVVVEEGNETVIPGAILRFQGSGMTGMVADDKGAFQSAELAPGTYDLVVTAPDYQEGTCQAVITPIAEGAEGAEGAAPATDAAAGPSDAAAAPPEAATAEAAKDAAAGDKPAADAPHLTQVRCALKAKPKLGTVVIMITDAVAQSGVPGATVTPTTEDGRSVSLEADEEGATRFNNVPVGTLRVAVEAPGYYKAFKMVKVVPSQEITSGIALVKAGKPTISVGAKGLVFKKPIRFKPTTAELTPESLGVAYELANVMSEHPELSIEIQAHTDDSVAFQQALSLTTDRANAIREILLANGVQATRVAAIGAGSATPLVPNANAKAREKNNRVDITVKGAATP
ncbi:MAG TPA: carboxypeptidase regulatory-like domain-containing protein [Polyangiaceae bacterium]|jgi:outer membrane protein OmpA-like peptidoglycan-associated protein|nr:carboxypeptidase regulatory-like domain-containing protein [Polyangiaceae bacterium]